MRDSKRAWPTQLRLSLSPLRIAAACLIASTLLAGRSDAREPHRRRPPPPAGHGIPAEDPFLTAEHRHAADVTRQPRRYGLTISGGISLGAYEAGLNWGLLRLMRVSAAPDDGGGTKNGQRKDLGAVTGASAGSINAVLSAIEWCRQEPSSIDQNLFFETWVPIGFEHLFPGSATCREYRETLGHPPGMDCKAHNSAYRADDGVFSRQAFSQALSQVRHAVATGDFRRDCQTTVGVTVTKANSDAVEGGITGLNAPTQRFAVLLNAEARDGRLRFRQYRDDDPLIGRRLYLPSRQSEIEIDQVFAIIQASSAFPVAFGPMELTYCTALDESGSCSGDTRAWFLDGGVFDNLPIGLALAALRSDPNLLAVEQDEDVMLSYLDPSRRRVETPLPQAAQDQHAPSPDRQNAPRGLEHLVSLVSRFVSVARNYELQSAIRFGTTGHLVTAEPTSRYSSIFGAYLGAFGAFMARPFREYDYYAGVYDAAIYMASLSCGIESSKPHLRPDQAECLVSAFVKATSQLGIAKNGSAAWLAQRMFQRELSARMPDEPGQTVARLLQGIGRLNQVTSPDPIIVALDETIASSRVEPEFLDMLSTLRAKLVLNRSFGRLSHSEQALLSNPAEFLGVVARQVAQRLVDIEAAEAGSGKGGIGTTIADLTQFGVEAYFNGREYRRQWVWSPSTIPQSADWKGRLWGVVAPYYLTAELLDKAGLELGYLPSFYNLLGPGIGLAAPIAPISWSRTDHSLGIRAGLSLFLTRLGLAPRNRFEFGPYIGANYTGRGRDGNDRVDAGLEATGQFIFNHLRLSVAVERHIDRDADYRLLFHVGVADLNGLTYWAARTF
jgi:predicted acylesterase/phospholipase RssA